MAGLGCLVATVAIWLPCHGNEPTPARFIPESAMARSAGDPVAGGSGVGAVVGSGGETCTRQAVENPKADTDRTPTLRVRLRGILPSAPWTVGLGLRWKGGDGRSERKEHDAREKVDPEGTCTFVLPEFVPGATTRSWQFAARDPNYLPLDELLERNLDLAEELVLDVQAVAVLTGRVVDARGSPVEAAKLTAFGMHEGKPVTPPLGTTNTFFDGSYRLRVPPDTELFLVAVAMEEARINGLVMNTEDGIATLDTARPQLLPASARATGMLGSPRTVPDLVLGDAPTITGIVQWSDRTPIANAVLVELAGESDEFALPIAESSGVRRLKNGELVLGGGAVSRADGTFTMPWIASGTHRLMLARLKGAELVADVVTPALPPPARTVVAVPLPTIVRAVRDGAPVPYATIDTGMGTYRTDAHGELRIVAGIDLTVMAQSGPARSAPATVGPGQIGQTVDLQLTTALTRVVIEFTGEFRVRNAAFRWRRDDGTEGRQFSARDDRGDPFELFLAPGHYALHTGPSGGERNGLYLLPIDREIDVGTAELRLELPAVFGGTFTLQVTDGTGRPVAGTCSVHAANGDDVTAPFLSATNALDAPGVFTDDSPARFTRILPSGTYDLELTFAEFGVQRTKVEIRARETAEVRLRLP